MVAAAKEEEPELEVALALALALAARCLVMFIVEVVVLEVVGIHVSLCVNKPSIAPSATQQVEMEENY